MKRRNPRFGCRRIAQQIAETFGIDIDKDVVRRVLATHYQLKVNDDGPSWLTFLSQAMVSLWSLDVFRAESILLLFWSAEDLERKLELFRRYYHNPWVHQGLEGDTPDEKAGSPGLQRATLERHAWRSHCHGLFDLPIAA